MKKMQSSYNANIGPVKSWTRDKKIWIMTQWWLTVTFYITSATIEINLDISA